ncbi:CPBP family glutamic-type intramembrane protease [Asticcacaulis solisilvae]|uniref:CPBP family glutamic-type intramembrane protease n=1 Tax=Asticcacaulis solisilvae TaxID=1217274 RepID=UPI003FD8656C
MASSVGSAASRLAYGLQIVGAVAGLFVASALIGTFVTPHLPSPLRTPVLGLALWGGVLTGAWMLHLSKTSYAAIGFTRPKSLLTCAVWVVVAIMLSQGGALAIGEVLKRMTGWAPLDVGYIRQSIQGNMAAYATWIILVVWGSAAFGEELLVRGFIMDRLQGVFGHGVVGICLAVLGQAAIFGLLHAIQGPAGVLMTAWIGAVLAGVYFASGRNLWAPIIAHGLMDTASLTLIFLGYHLPGFIH